MKRAISKKGQMLMGRAYEKGELQIGRAFAMIYLVPHGTLF